MKMIGRFAEFFTFSCLPDSQRVTEISLDSPRGGLASKSKRRQRSGFTLVEAILALAISVIAGGAIVLGLASSLQTTTIAEDETIGLGMVKAMMDEIAGMRYAEVGAGPYQITLGPESGEITANGRPQFDDIDDFAGLSTQPPTDFWGIALGSDDGEGSLRHSEMMAPAGRFDSWRRDVDVYYANPTDFDTRLPAGVTSDYRVVIVRVIRTDIDGSAHELARLQRVFSYVPKP